MKKQSDPNPSNPPRAPGAPPSLSFGGAASDLPAPAPPTGLYRRWVAFGERRPVFRFVGLVAFLMGAFYGLMLIPWFGETFWTGYLKLNAHATAIVLTAIGHPAQVDDLRVSTSRYSVEIRRGCDAIEPMALFLAAVAALNVPRRTRIIGAVAGTLVLLLMNLVRIVSLYFTGVHWPSAFETMHVDVWQPAFVVLTVGLWTGWALWATKPGKPGADVAA